ncbi:methionine ABC transporter ATP-binding protein [Ectobacillus sp. sgz5001026]|uniref:methionine ABC transporter ATP-binding protein n=1 Tax=Ectobacillus sp. sgz5001026 TaxID=3242473 RepID=UPI0036D25ACE
MIVVKDVSKVYKTSKQTIQALDHINLKIEKGDIFGIIGFSGAGKSTLIRCLNRLEDPSEGSIEIAGQRITELGEKELQLARRKIGMIFQHFNLFDSMTVFQNIAFPLQIAGQKKSDIDKKVTELLELVNLSDKGMAYPAALSGGQKQRVGIARALVNDPHVLLCDEATSALDPQTTYSILELLQDINRKLNLTIVLITHELDVLGHICNNMAVLENGKIIETGSVDSFFLHPSSETARRFVRILEYYRQKREAWDHMGGVI